MSDELAALQAELDALRAETEKKAEAQTDALANLKDEIEAEKALALALDEHGKNNVCLIRSKAGSFILKRPSRIAWKKYLAQMGKAKDNGERLFDLSDQMVARHLIYPPQDVVAARLDEYPGLIDPMVDELRKLAAAGAKALGE